MENRVFNFSPGPAVLPEPVVATVRDNLMNYAGTGLGIMEMSHRGPEFQEIQDTTTANLREILSISDDYAIAYATGGATNQFSMVPMNLLSSGMTADYIVSGSWAKKAFAEAKKFGEANEAASSADSNYSYIPGDLSRSNNSAYLHYTSNNTIFGTQFSTEPDSGGAPLVCDASSDLLHKAIDVNKYGLIYAGAQKNLGPAGITIVIINRSLLERTPSGLPVLLDYNTYVDKDSTYNTIPTFPVYVVGEVFKWIKTEGGLSAIAERNQQKAKLIYDAVDAGEFYRGTAREDSRSVMNVTFRIHDEALEPVFVKEANEQGLSGLKGHRSVGGLRASIYNAFPLAGVEALVSFMQEFEAKHG